MPDPNAECPVVGWCTGKDCRAADRDGALRALASKRAQLVELRCLDLCDGAVVVGRPDGDEPVVFRKVRKRRVLRDVLDHLVDGAELTPAAAKRQVTGSKRKRAVRRIERRR